MEPHRFYSFFQLTKISGLGRHTLENYKEKGWLVPVGSTGKQLRYNLQALNQAAEMSLKAGKIAKMESHTLPAPNWALILEN